jgi:hypothetical protein
MKRQATGIAERANAGIVRYGGISEEIVILSRREGSACTAKGKADPSLCSG